MTRVLIVDDHPDIRALIRVALDRDGAYELREAPDGDAAWVAAQDWRPDVLLLDVMMPGRLDGLAVCQKVRQSPALNHTKVVILSARTGPGDVERGWQAGAHEYLVKPFSPRALARRVAELAGVAAGGGPDGAGATAS